MVNITWIGIDSSLQTNDSTVFVTRSSHGSTLTLHEKILDDSNSKSLWLDKYDSDISLPFTTLS